MKSPWEVIPRILIHSVVLVIGLISAGTRVVKKLIRIEISISYHLLSVSQRLCLLPQMKLRIG